MSEKVLVVGNNVRNVAESARKVGYEVIAITKFADADLEIYCSRVYEIDDSCENVKKLVENVAESEKAKVVLCSGYESLEVDAELLCSDPRECKKIVDKLKFYRTLEKAGIPHPELVDSSEGKTISKPRFGGGGEEVELTDKIKDGFILQRFIDGIPCSVSLIVSDEAIPIACNLILAGWKEMNASGFRYSGNVTPLDVSIEKRQELERIAVETVELFDLRGSVGVDFVLADKPYVLEINPRFQGSLDSIEWSCDINIFDLHVRAFDRKRIERPKPRRYAIRAVLFADREVKIKRSFAGNPFYADVPKVGSVYLANDPLVSILASGESCEEVKAKAVERRDLFLSLI